MNVGILNALNSVAAAAAAAKDLDTCSALQQAACFIQRDIGNLYDSVAYNASATAFVVANPPQILDVQAAVAKILGIPPSQLGN